MNTNRRKFLKHGKTTITGLVTLSILPLGLSACGNSDEINLDKLVKIGRLDDLQSGEFPKKVKYEGKVKNGLFTQERKGFVYVVKNESKNELLFMSPLCTHLECETTIAEPEMQRQGITFYCPCHQGAFDELGVNVSGPPERPLDVFNTAIIDNEVYLEILDPIQREK